VDTDGVAVAPGSVIAGDDHGGLVVKARDGRARGGQAGAAGGVRGQVLVEVVVLEPGDGWLEDVSRRRRSRRNAPSLATSQQRGLRLRAGKAELPGEGPSEPRRSVLLKLAEPSRDAVFVQRCHRARSPEAEWL
jgi:hypothetical protein